MGSNRNTIWARAFMDELAKSGVQDVCIAPGSRSTPLVLACAEDPRFRPFVHLDERSAAYFALGVGKSTGRPGVVITTSGTAAANLYPAVIEAAQSETPLILLTADRPHRLRDADANQAIDQIRLFGRFVRSFYEVAPPEIAEDALLHLRSLACRAVADAVGLPAGPVHLNFPFAKPLEPTEGPGDVPAEDEMHPLATRGRDGSAPFVDIRPRRLQADPEDVAQLLERLAESSRGLLVAGPSADSERTGEAVVRFAAATGSPLLADPLSGARFRNTHGATVLGRYDLFLREEEVRRHLAPDLIVRIGASPTSAALLTFLQENAATPQLVVDAGHLWKDHLASASQCYQADPVLFLDALSDQAPRRGAPEWRMLWEHAEEIAGNALAHMRGEFFFEGDVLSTVAAALPEGASLFVSSSMPVRDLDAFGAHRSERLRVLGNRGASGIDGVVSTALGVAATSEGPTVAVLGDVAFCHDMNGLLAARRHGMDVTFVVIHNDGGGIFHMLPIREREPSFTSFFAAPHGLDFRHVAELYSLHYSRIEESSEAVTELREALEAAVEEGGARLVEVRTDREENHRRHQEIVEAVGRALRSELIEGEAE
ncbi:MAG: 2-succinyl-5-enolpyruvyl-6-hydroxy-3-cyclohexene-1-carboxylic-acid synthase [Gemmatimonadetes bacterium]|nr:2-succinyl-5-enolpyruvyl-6-hydroxy-3-cyclohexene-1-carboxylic-acid synthase [Gemmatimonadota bacterium]